MIHRNSRKDDMHFGKWNAPGGKVEPGESPEECVLREVYEETGLHLKSPRMRGVLTFPAFDGQEDWYVFVFTGREFQGQLKNSCHEGDLFWLNDSELKHIPLWEGDRIFMEWLEGNRFFSGKFVYDSDGFKSHEVIFYSVDGTETV